MEPIQNYKDLTLRASAMTAEQKQGLHKIYAFSVMVYVEESIKYASTFGYSQVDIIFPNDITTYGGGPFTYVDNGIDRLIVTVVYPQLEESEFNILKSELEIMGYAASITIEENKINVNWA